VLASQPIFAAAHADGFASASSRASTPADGSFNGARPLRIDELDAHVAQRHTPKRVNFRGPLKFGKGCTIGVKGYVPYRGRARRRTFAYVGRG